ncbi:MAG: O-succinylbenzoate--CoA ligase [Actinobacteria bacterium]|nr:MAG: O-succinylbenzoate--CoA ligase [Actinomycetota bacterium]
MPSRIAALVAERGERAAPDAALVEGRTGQTVTWGDLAGRVDEWTGRSDLAGRAVLLKEERPLAFITAYLGLLAAGAVVFPMAPDAPETDVAAALAGFGIDVNPEANPMNPASRSQAAPVGWAEPGTVVLRTSGTTGTPKGVPLGEARLLHAASLVARHHGFSPDDTVYSSLPLFHINAQVVGVLASLVSGATLAVDDRFHRRGFWDVMDRCGVTVINAVPAILAILAEEPPAATVAARIRFARSASAPLPPTTLRRFEERCGIGVLETYGMTEAAGQICANPLEPAARRPGSVGPPVSLDLRVVDGQGATVAPGAAGLIEILGPTVVDHYLVPGAPPSRVPAGGASGWLRTGDVGYRDDGGFVHLLGRIDGVINRGGEKVYPRHVEDVLRRHPGVAEVAVVGEPDPVLGERPVAFVVARARTPGNGLTNGLTHGLRGDPAGDLARFQEELFELCERELSRHQRPARIHLARSLPSTPTGKVRPDALRAMAAS